jgi:hypothetical protein
MMRFANQLLGAVDFGVHQKCTNEFGGKSVPQVEMQLAGRDLVIVIEKISDCDGDRRYGNKKISEIVKRVDLLLKSMILLQQKILKAIEGKCGIFPSHIDLRQWDGFMKGQPFDSCRSRKVCGHGVGLKGVFYYTHSITLGVEDFNVVSE